jgi:hypothetical protein
MADLSGNLLLDWLPATARRACLEASERVGVSLLACNSYHSIAERLARWLLVLHERVERDELALTHDMLSQMLAATRRHRQLLPWVQR